MYAIARTGKGRPTLQHRIVSDEFGIQVTACGRDIGGWSRAYQAHVIPQVYCKQCNRTERKSKI